MVEQGKAEDDDDEVEDKDVDNEDDDDGAKDEEFAKADNDDEEDVNLNDGNEDKEVLDFICMVFEFKYKLNFVYKIINIFRTIFVIKLICHNMLLTLICKNCCNIKTTVLCLRYLL